MAPVCPLQRDPNGSTRVILGRNDVRPAGLQHLRPSTSSMRHGWSLKTSTCTDPARHEASTRRADLTHALALMAS